MDESLMSFEAALTALKGGLRVARKGWNNPDISVYVQVPDGGSKMTKPYLVMQKYEEFFPLDLSCESIFATDWFIVK